MLTASASPDSEKACRADSTPMASTPRSWADAPEAPSTEVLQLWVLPGSPWVARIPGDSSGRLRGPPGGWGLARRRIALEVSC